MDELERLQDEISEKICTLSCEKLAKLSVTLNLIREEETNMTRLSLLGTLSNYLLRPELEELEDGGMAELLTINDNLSQLMGITVKDSDPGAMREENKLGDVRIVQRERPESGKSAAELGPSRHISPATVQNAGDRQTYVDHGSGYSPHTSQRQINSTWRKDFKISGLIGDPGQKDRLSFSSLARQIESGLNKDYSEQEIVDSVIRAITPGLQLRSYLEGKVGLTLPVLRRILRSHYQEKNATELYKQLTTEAQRSRETPQSFLIRAFDLRQKVLFASQEDDSGLRYDPALVQNMFLHTVLTGLQSDRVQSDLQTCLSDPTVPDECFAAYNKEPTAAVSPQHQISTQGSRQTSGWTVQEHQTWKPDTATCSQQAGPCMPPHQPSQSQNQWREQDILLTPAKLAQCPSGPQEQYLQSSQRYVVPETHHGQPYGFPSPQQHPMPISYATHPSSFTTSQYYPQQYMAPPQPHPYQFRQTRPSRARQCFHCQRRKAEEPCTHCYRCGSNEHFLAGCKEGGSRVQHRVQLNGDGLPPRDRE
ncbi:hypothetical protein DPEC_G00336360 [Dallia pectoralis]|uniref:Uncharacterized protein n=1 Tax=Dallia pectoralis TaxID=75939 RepID=A0ACC2F780_DALPE|nr:hypothetical protein DPEC_G00336360 [Dallia pectoralis]